MQITKKEYNQEFNKIIKKYNLNKKDINHKIDTIFGGYIFTFSDDTIFGRFDNIELIKNINGLKLFNKKVNPFSGKFNFHFNDVFIFIETINKLKNKG